MRLLPREGVFLELFADCATACVQATALLAQVLGAVPGEHRRSLVRQLTDLEHAADSTTHEVVRRLHSTFVTPFDREDIYCLATGLDDCVDILEAAAARVLAYRLDAVPDALLEQVAVLQRQAELTAAAMPRLAGMRGLADYWVEVNRLENEAERVHRGVLDALFDPAAPSTPAGAPLVALLDVTGRLKAAAEAFERVAHTVELLAVKEA